MNVRLLTLLLAAVFALAACGGSKFERPGYAFGCPTGDNKKIKDKESLIVAKVERSGKTDDIEVADLRCSERSSLLRIDIDLKNDGKDVRRIAYRFRWLDKEGMRAWDDESWKPLLLYANTNYTVTTLSPSQEATDFRIVLMDQDK
jgi:uncharacterized protein YcfL